MTRRSLLATTTLSALLLAAACASTGSPVRQASTGNDCVFLRIVDGWEVLDNSSVLVRTSGAPDRRSYLVRLTRPAPELRFAADLRLLDGNGDGQICGWGGDSVITSGATAQRYRIRAVERLSEHQLEDLLGSSPDGRDTRRKSSSLDER
jgi:hypothetical protein